MLESCNNLRTYEQPLQVQKIMSDLTNLDVKIEKIASSTDADLNKVKAFLAIKKSISEDKDFTESINKTIDKVNDLMSQFITTIKTGSFEEKVPLAHLIESSFESMLKFGTTEQAKNLINWEIEKENRFNKEEVAAFLQFLKTQEITLNEENVMPLLALADLYQVKLLTARCAEFLQKNVTYDNTPWELFPDLLNAGIASGNQKLIWFAVYLAMSDRDRIKTLGKEPHWNVQTQQIIEDLKQIAQTKNKIIIFHKIPTVEIKEATIALELLNNISKVVDLTMLIGGIFSSETLLSLTKTCPFVSHLITSFNIHLDELKEIIKNFKRLKSVSFEVYTYDGFLECKNKLHPIEPNVLLHSFFTNSDLDKLSKLNLKYMKSWRSHGGNFNIIPFENLEVINCKFCINLKNIPAENALMVYCDNTSITTLNAPIATNASFHDCPYLISVDIPDVEIVENKECPALTTLNAANAKVVGLFNCSSLANLHIPKATKVAISPSSLTTLDVPSANTVNIGNSTLLTSINAANAETISCSFCPSLKEINAPHAKKISLYKCPLDIILNVPKDCVIER